MVYDRMNPDLETLRNILMNYVVIDYGRDAYPLSIAEAELLIKWLRKPRAKRLKRIYKRTCKLCNETQTLDAIPRSEICRPCRTSKIGIRTGTGSKTGVITPYGYRMIMVNKQAIFEHRHIMEVFLGRKLLVTEHVHHKDGNKLNNNIDNLEVMSPSDHHREHMTPERAKRLSKLAHEAKRLLRGR